MLSSTSSFLLPNVLRIDFPKKLLSKHEVFKNKIRSVTKADNSIYQKFICVYKTTISPTSKKIRGYEACIFTIQVGLQYANI